MPKGWRILRIFLILLSFAWMAGASWWEYTRPVNEEMEAYRQQQYEQRLKDCRGAFADRYDCKSATLREQKSELFDIWSRRTILVAGPPLTIGLLFLTVYGLTQRRRQRWLQAERARRLEQEREEFRQHRWKS